MKINHVSQLELGWENQRPCGSLSRRRRRLKVASFWFNRMREVVDRAMDHTPAPRPRPEQIYFEQLTHRA